MIILGKVISPNTILYLFMAGVLLWLFIKFSTHRLLVKTYYMVNDGYVAKQGRYKIKTDKDTNLEYLNPMFGKGKLPIANSLCWQKVNSIPFIGVLRAVNYVFDRAIPSAALLPTGEIFYFNVKRWLYMTERNKLNTENKRKKIVRFLEIYTGVLVVVSTFIFFGVMIFLEIKNDQFVAARLEELVRYTEALMKGG